MSPLATPTLLTRSKIERGEELLKASKLEEPSS